MGDLDAFSLILGPAQSLPPGLAIPVLLWAFAVGSTVGSFLNVVIYRVPRDQKVHEPKRSHCPHCGVQIVWYDNIPVFSWFALRGRCRRCGGPIAFRYAFVEALVGLLLVGLAWRYGLGLEGWLFFGFAVVLIAIAYIDLDFFFIPWSTLGALATVGAVALVVELVLGAPVGTVVGAEGATADAGLWAIVGPRVLGGVGGLVVLAAFKVLADTVARLAGRIGPDEEAMGWGDPLLLGAIGLFLGWQALPLVVFLGSAQGALAGFAMKLTGRLHAGGLPESNKELIEQARATSGAADGSPEGAGQAARDAEPHPLEDDTVPPGAVPFGPFLALGALEVAFFGASWLPLLYGALLLSPDL